MADCAAIGAGASIERRIVWSSREPASVRPRAISGETPCEEQIIAGKKDGARRARPRTWNGEVAGFDIHEQSAGEIDRT